VEAAVKSPLQSLVTKTDPNDLTGTVVVVGGEKFHVKDMFAEGGAARVYRCSLVVGDGPESDGHTAVSDSKQTKKANSLALKQCLLNPELSDAEARHERETSRQVVLSGRSRGCEDARERLAG